MSDAYTKTWLRDGSIETVSVPNGALIRYVKAGQGAPLVLVHTLRTQLDYFEKLLPLLQENYTVYALDLPGLGSSTLPKGAVPVEPFFRESVYQFMEALDLRDVTLVGESIGGTLALTVAAVQPERIRKIFALNPYDYGEMFGGGIRRSRFGFIIGLFTVFGPFTLEARPFLKLVLRGSVANPHALPDSLVKELDRVGWRGGYRTREYLLFKHWRSWLEAVQAYANVKVPVTIIYGQHDWSRPAEREHHRTLLPHATMHTVPNAGHFSSLDAPETIAAIINQDFDK
jgi:pimeloyl-ACP methyl ester carboxylesterase